MASGLRRKEEDVTFDEVKGKDWQREINELHVLTESVQDRARVCVLEVRKGGAGERQYAPHCVHHAPGPALPQDGLQQVRMETERGVSHNVDKEQPASSALAQHQQEKELTMFQPP